MGRVTAVGIRYDLVSSGHLLQLSTQAYLRALGPYPGFPRRQRHAVIRDGNMVQRPFGTLIASGRDSRSLTDVYRHAERAGTPRPCTEYERGSAGDSLTLSCPALPVRRTYYSKPASSVCIHKAETGFPHTFRSSINDSPSWQSLHLQLELRHIAASIGQ